MIVCLVRHGQWHWWSGEFLRQRKLEEREKEREEEREEEREKEREEEREEEREKVGATLHKNLWKTHCTEDGNTAKFAKVFIHKSFGYTRYYKDY